MRNQLARVVGVLVVSAAAHSQGQTNSFEMPTLGRSLPAAKYELVNRIPAKQAKRLPKTLAVFRYSAKPREFSVVGLQMLLDQSVFAGTNFADLLHGYTNVALIDQPIRLATERNLDYFFVNPAGGGIVSYNQGKGVDFRRDNPAYDSVPNFESIRDSVFRYAGMFGVSTNEMERKEDGSILLRKTDDKTVARGGAIKFISRRSVEVFRSVAGYTFLGNDDKIELALGANGQLQKFEMKWRSMEAVRTNRLYTINEMADQIKKGRVLAHMMNQYPDDGVAQIILKDIRIQYYVLTPSRFGPISTDADIYPVASFHAVFKSKSGKTEEGGLFATIMDSP